MSSENGSGAGLPDAALGLLVTDALLGLGALANKDQRVKELQLKPSRRVVGQGQPVGTLYRLSDGRTIVVRNRS